MRTLNLLREKEQSHRQCHRMRIVVVEGRSIIMAMDTGMVLAHTVYVGALATIRIFGDKQ